MGKTTSERFWAKVDKSGDCWEWQARITKYGYGQFWFEGAAENAHRFAWRESSGATTQGMDIDHTCHNRRCVRPAHLRETTRRQNAENRKGADSDNPSGVRGVHWSKRSRKWQAYVRHNGHLNHVGYFSLKADAEAAVVAKRLELFTHNDHDREAA